MSREKDDIKSVGAAIRELLHTFRIDSKFDEATLVNSWERLVGAPIAKRTKKVFVKNGVLFVEFKTPAMKNDFLLHKSKVLEVFQKEFGQTIVTDIIIL